MTREQAIAAVEKAARGITIAEKPTREDIASWKRIKLRRVPKTRPRSLWRVVGPGMSQRAVRASPTFTLRTLAISMFVYEKGVGTVGEKLMEAGQRKVWGWWFRRGYRCVRVTRPKRWAKMGRLYTDMRKPTP